MPLYQSLAPDAIALRKANPYCGWGNRETANRVEPIASPAFGFDIKLEPGDTIFTVGSCFARNVETKLEGAGFRIPMRDLFRQPSFAGIEAGALNNFSTPSIYNELAWAVGERTFDEDKSIIEYASDKWVDLNTAPSTKPAPRDHVVRRRHALSEAYRSFIDSKLVVITLGLLEVWFDRETDSYINAIPPPPVVRRYPERFELRVLDVFETLDFCERALGILLKHGRPDLQILMSVSPVALVATHRPGDVMIANCYSKSCLRTVAEHIAARHPQVNYFPSYESVTLSDRQVAWENDLIHVTDTLIRHNVDRLVSHLTSHLRDEGDFDAMEAAIADGGAATAQRLAQEVRKMDGATASHFFTRFGRYSRQSKIFATEHVEWLAEQKRFDEIASLVDEIGSSNQRIAMVAARAYLVARRPKDAVAVLTDPMFNGSRTARYWILLTEAQGKAGDLEGIDRALAGFALALPRRQSVARVHAARAFLSNSAIDRANQLVDLSLLEQPDFSSALLLKLEILSHQGKAAEAAALADRIVPTTASETVRLERLKSALKTKSLLPQD